MPNWCSAYMTLQGTKEELFDFFSEKILYRDGFDDSGQKMDLDEPLLIMEGDILHVKNPATQALIYSDTCWIKESPRHFLQVDGKIDFKLIGSETAKGEIYEAGIALEIAWGPDREVFQSIANTYNLQVELDAEEEMVAFHGYGFFKPNEEDTYVEYELDEWRKTKRYELFPDHDFSMEEQYESEDS